MGYQLFVVLLRFQRLFQADKDEEMLNLNAVPDRFSQDQLKQGPKTEGAEEESLYQAQEEVVVNAIDMEAGLQTPQPWKAWARARSWPGRAPKRMDKEWTTV